MTDILVAAAPPPPAGPPPAPKTRLAGLLVSKNVRIRGHRTSVRIEPEMWDALNEVAGVESCTIHDLCSAVEDLHHPDASFTGALRVFLMEYFRNAAKANRPVALIQKRMAEKDAKSR